MTSSAPPDYIPGPSGAMLDRQNAPRALRLLVAQRRLYTVAKRWQAVRWFGVLIIGIAAPVVAILWPQAAVAMGAIAGAWLFVGRTVLAWAEARLMTRAAVVQEEFDHYVFGMPETIERSGGPTREDIAHLVGPDDRLPGVVRKQRLADWYPIDAANSGARAVAIAQRANAAYSDRLLRATVTVWGVGSVAWTVLLIAISMVVGMSLATFLLGVALPVLPAFLDAFEYIRSTARAARDRADLARTIESRITAQSDEVEGQELLVWQERLFELRRTTPQIPNWLYRLLRPKNEMAMHAAAGQLNARPSEGTHPDE